MRTHIICAEHRVTALVGPGSLIEKYECPTCLDAPEPTPTDPEELFISRITSHYNGNCCCGSCEPSFCYNCSHYSDFCTCPVPLGVVTILSSNYCDGQPPF